MERLNKNQNIKVHFIGIGGIGMSGIAEVLLDFGFKVSGSDLSESAVTENLKKKGAEVYLGHARENIKNCTTIVYSSAINEKNPEIIEARENNIPLMRRAEMLAELMRLKHGIAIAGTHGKTTTTSFLATILQESEYDPTYIIGGIVDNLKGNAKVGKGRYLVAEADESDGSFLLLNPVMSVVTNIDFDHMEFYKTEENLLNSFERFMNKIPFYGLCALNAHDEKIKSLIPKMKKPWVTFGIDIESDFQAKNLIYKDFTTTFDLYFKGKLVEKIILSLPGRHNILNSLGAIALAHHMGLGFDTIASSITKFKGVNRRFQLLLEKGDFELLDDYGHHPTEIKETLSTLRKIRENKKVVAVFEPHRFTRTKDCWNDFIESFHDVDEVALLPIYPASEEPIEGVTSEKMSQDMSSHFSGSVKSYSSFSELGEYLKSKLNENVTVISLGAGSIGRNIRSWVKDNG